MYRSDALVRGRYRLLEPLGSGQHGEVWRARDEILGREVALKLLHTPDGLSFLARRELTALRLQELPGVVRMLDDGLVNDGGPAFLVMEIVEGPPLFPERGARVGWESLRPGVISLLRTLRALHAAGVIHRDLKAEHVRLDAQGQPVLLDLSAAAGPGVDLAPPRQRLEVGSLRTMAPEQLVDAERVDGRSDLYALGVMLFEALSGTAPHPETEPEALRLARLSRPAPKLEVPGLPGEVAGLIDRMLSRQRRDRPESAEAVLELLRAGAREELHGAFAHWAPGRFGEEELRGMFAGPNRLLHRQEDAARLVLTLTGGQREAVAALLSEWLSSAQARWEGGGLRLSERVFARPGAEALAQRLRELGPEAAFLSLRAELVALEDDGDTRRAVQRAEQALELARRGYGDQEAALLDRARLALVSGLGVEPALYEIERSGLGGDTLAAVEQLLRVARSCRAGRADDAAALLDGLPRLEDRRLDRWRVALWVHLALNTDAVKVWDAATQRVSGWAASHLDASPDVDGWLGILAYRRGDMPEAATLSRRAAESKAQAGARLSAGLNAVMALLDGGRPREALELAEPLLAKAGALRLAIYELRAEAFLRAARYRLDEAGPVDWELVEAVRALVQPIQAAGVLLTEAAVAWRRNELHAAATLAGEARQAWAEREDSDTGLLAACLEAACLATVPEAAIPEATVLTARAIRAPGLRLQALGILFWRDPSLRIVHQGHAEEVASKLPDFLSNGRREILSVQEILFGVHNSGAGAM